MKKIIILLCLFTLTTVAARAQDAETTERLTKLENYLQELQAAQVAQDKSIQALEKDVIELREKLGQPAANNFAAQDDLAKLAAQVQDLAKKQQSDNDLIVKQIENLGKISTGSTTSHRAPPTAPPTRSTDNPTPGGQQSGFYYKVKEKDTLSGIAKWYREQKPPIKVTVDDILKANPGLDAKTLIVGNKIFIPAPQ